MEWTLLRFRPAAAPGDEVVDAARRRRLDLKVVDLPDPRLRDLYDADLALIRPDQINQAYERVVNKDVRYRFVIDMASM